MVRRGCDRRVYVHGVGRTDVVETIEEAV